MEEADAQTAVGDAIEAATANAIAARNHAYVEKLAAGSGARGTLYTAAPGRPSPATSCRHRGRGPATARRRDSCEGNR